MILLFSDGKLHFSLNPLSINTLPIISTCFLPLVNYSCAIAKLHLSFQEDAQLQLMSYSTVTSQLY